MKAHESPRIRKKSIRGDSGDSWPVWNRGIRHRCSARCGVDVVFVALRPMSTAMVIAGRSVHLTTLFPGQA